MTSIPKLQLAIVVFISVCQDTLSHGISASKMDVMQKGIEAGENLMQHLNVDEEVAALRGVHEALTPWLNSLSIFVRLQQTLTTEDIQDLDSMKIRFQKMHREVDALRDKVQQLTWESASQLVDRIERAKYFENIIEKMYKSLNCFKTHPDHEINVDSVLDVYEEHYKEAGEAVFKELADLMVTDISTTNNSVDSDNDVKGLFKRWLLGLLMRAITVETSYEVLKQETPKTRDIWLERFSKCLKSLEEGDITLQESWQNFKSESDKFASDCSSCSHSDFTTRLFDQLNGEYYWRYWLVLSYDPVQGNSEHSLHIDPTYVHYRWRYYNRNFVVATSDSGDVFDPAIAISYIQDRYCRDYLRDCQDSAALIVRDRAPTYGKLLFVLTKSASFSAWRHVPRYTRADAYFFKDSWHASFRMIYFG